MGKEVDLLTKNLMILSSLFYLIAVSAMSIITETEINLTFIGLISFLIYIIAFFSIYKRGLLKTILPWVLPIAISLTFYIIWNLNIIPVISRMDGPIVSVLNVLFSYIFNMIIFAFLTKHHKKELKQHKKAIKQAQKAQQRDNIINELRDELDDIKQKSKVTENNFNVKLRGIEDKCKAINFTIGRVYSDKHEGSKAVRNRLRIDKDLYNAFSKMTSDFEKHNISYLLDILSRLYTEISSLELTEIQYIGRRILNKYEDEQIISILSRNDEEPVLESYTEAKEICEGLIKFVKGEDF